MLRPFDLDPGFKLIDTYPALPGDPASHRWRASWNRDGGTFYGIFLKAYLVVRQTRCGVWIAEDSFWDPRVGWTERGPDKDLRFLHNKSRAAWVKSTRAEALHILMVRLDRWAAHVARDRHHVQLACEAAAALIPDVASALLERAKDTLS